MIVHPEVRHIISQLPDHLQDEVWHAICSRGNREGKLLKNPPALHKKGNVAWHAIMMNIAPQRAGVWHYFCYSVMEKEAYTEIEHWACKYMPIINDRLQSPCEFNLFHLQRSNNDDGKPYENRCRHTLNMFEEG